MKKKLEENSKSIDELFKIKRPSRGVFNDIRELTEFLGATYKPKLFKGLLNDHGVSRVPTSGIGLKKSTEIANKIFHKYGFPLEVPKKAPSVEHIVGYAFQAEINKLDNHLRLMIEEGDQEIQAAFELRCSTLAMKKFMRYAGNKNKPNPDFQDLMIDYGICHAVRVGQLLALLEIQDKSGNLVDQRKKSISAIKARNKKMQASPKEIRFLEKMWIEYWSGALTNAKNKTVNGALEWMVNKINNRRFKRAVKGSSKKSDDEKQRERYGRIIKKHRESVPESFPLPN